ncbi:hypothetical protein ACH61_01906 [Rathayibacter tanaceti]|uniref:Uncharacterized protein n=1 Tax=Rathayibacter tanaceti TaxID=1671680 RepID=A0A162J1T9_9MICO|nr:hypothetical protein ACH61_01906 [Rathayibacter tanaceti]
MYSSLPAPALLQQIWTSSWLLLNRSTTPSNSGYQAHIVTTFASGFTTVFSQLAASLPAEQPVRAAAEAQTATPAASSLVE